MAVGRSGRIVVELEPELKRRFYSRLRSEGRDFKGWLLERVQDYLAISRDSEQAPSDLSELEKRVLEAMSSDVLVQHHVDDLVHATGLDVREIREALLLLELRGRIVEHVGLYRRPRP
jgi:predicted Rossmann fold nucleotide-binding protein DprA/Smf involved in DNA uptake